MNTVAIDDEDVARITALAAILLPGTATMPAVARIDGFGGLVRTACKACGYADGDIRTALDQLGTGMVWDDAKALAAASPASFHIVSTLASAAYFMAPAVLDALGYPIERRHPAGVEDFVAEYETGILDAVTKRGPIFREIRTTA